MTPDLDRLLDRLEALRRQHARRVVVGIAGPPSFDHAVGEPVPDAITVPADADVVVTEGNYLLLGEGGWRAVPPLLDEVWFCALDDTVRQERLVARHIEAGREQADAQAWVARSDEANALLVTPTAAHADLVLHDGRVVGQG